MTLTGRILRKVLPKPAADQLAFAKNTYRHYRQLSRELAALRCQHAACQSLNEQIELILNHKVFGAMQRSREITDLLEMLQKNPPRYVCEIGTASGGTLFLLAQVSSPRGLLLSVDKELSLERSLVHARFAVAEQRIISIRKDSRAPDTVEQVRSVLRGNLLDLLFIDGDHTYEGVKADFTNYEPLVAKGGLIVFHDILADFRTRYGVVTPGAPYTGEVPVFWQQVKVKHKTSEIIEDPEQDGFGIGVTYN